MPGQVPTSLLVTISAKPDSDALVRPPAWAYENFVTSLSGLELDCAATPLGGAGRWHPEMAQVDGRVRSRRGSKKASAARRSAVATMRDAHGISERRAEQPKVPPTMSVEWLRRGVHSWAPIVARSATDRFGRTTAPCVLACAAWRPSADGSAIVGSGCCSRVRACARTTKSCGGFIGKRGCKFAAAAGASGRLGPGRRSRRPTR